MTLFQSIVYSRNDKDVNESIGHNAGVSVFFKFPSWAFWCQWQRETTRLRPKCSRNSKIETKFTIWWWDLRKKNSSKKVDFSPDLHHICNCHENVKTHGHTIHTSNFCEGWIIIGFWKFQHLSATRLFKTLVKSYLGGIPAPRHLVRPRVNFQLNNCHYYSFL